jgi:tripartite-type tricarboxylate transporter receptor subunit TctC
MKRLVFDVLRVLFLTALASTAHGVEPPIDNSITIVSGYASGGLSDHLARLAASHFANELKTPVVVKNLPGAAGLRAAQEVIQIPTNSTTILLTDSSLWRNTAMSDSASVNFSSLIPIGSMGYSALALAVGQHSPIQNMNELSKILRSQDAQSSFGSPGQGSIHQLFGERLLSQIGSHAVHIPYQGGNAMLPDLFQNRLTFGLMTISLASKQAKGGNLRILATTGESRSQFLPEIPAIAEIYPNLTAVTTAYLLASPHTSKQQMDRLVQSWNRIIKDPAFIQGLVNLELEPLLLNNINTRNLIDKETMHLRHLGLKTQDQPKIKMHPH